MVRRFRLRYLPILVVALLMQIAAPVLACLAMTAAEADGPIPGIVICYHGEDAGGPSDHGQPTADSACCTYCVVAAFALEPPAPPLPIGPVVISRPSRNGTLASQIAARLVDGKPYAARAPPERV
jgi:hypothetical protein